MSYTDVCYTVIGLVIGIVVTYYFAVLPRIHDIRQMRYRGFSADLPMPPAPERLETPEIHEGLH
jgi:hypothetical protein